MSELARKLQPQQGVIRVVDLPAGVAPGRIHPRDYLTLRGPDPLPPGAG